MTGFAHGLLIGKFYPPHLGHRVAIRAAAVQCGRLSVVVMASAAETIPLAERVAWLRAEHTGDAGVTVVGVRCDAPLDLTDPLVWEGTRPLVRRGGGVHRAGAGLAVRGRRCARIWRRHGPTSPPPPAQGW